MKRFMGYLKALVGSSDSCSSALRQILLGSAAAAVNLGLILGSAAGQQPAADADSTAAAANAPDCRPQLDSQPSFDSRILTAFGFNDTSCCGASRRCENLPATCFPRGSQEDACRQHDRDLVGHNALDFHDPASTRANGRFADQSTSWPIATAMRGLEWLGRVVQSFDAAPQAARNWTNTGLPLYPSNVQTSEASTPPTTPGSPAPTSFNPEPTATATSYNPEPTATATATPPANPTDASDRQFRAGMDRSMREFQVVDASNQRQPPPIQRPTAPRRRATMLTPPSHSSRRPARTRTARLPSIRTPRLPATMIPRAMHRAIPMSIRTRPARTGRTIRPGKAGPLAAHKV